MFKYNLNYNSAESFENFQEDILNGAKFREVFWSQEFKFTDKYTTADTQKCSARKLSWKINKKTCEPYSLFFIKMRLQEKFFLRILPNFKKYLQKYALGIFLGIFQNF